MPTDTLTARPRLRVGRTLGITASVILGVFVGAAALLFGFRFARDGALPGSVVDGVEVGGLERAELVAALSEYGQEQGGELVIVTATLPSGAAGESVTSTAEEVGWRLDIEETADRVLSRGRQGNPLEALEDHLRAFGATTEIEPVVEVAPDRLEAWADATAGALEAAPTEGEVRFEGAQVVSVAPAPGVDVDDAEVREEGRAAALTDGDQQVTLTATPVPPTTTPEVVAEAAARAERAVSAPVTFVRGDAEATLSPEQIAAALRVVRAEDGTFELAADPGPLGAALGDLRRFESEPQDATVRLQGGQPVVVPGVDGFRVDLAAAAPQLAEVAAGEGERVVQLAGAAVEPERTTAEAEALQITQKVSEFTTMHPCCQNRVQNIHRIADLIEGVVIEPGQSFSVNDFVGERTREKGFVADAAIQRGEFVEEVGGGVSQFATTMFNAAYFGGYDIVEYKPHSQYISRYPEGREATLNFPNVDLEIRNNSPFGILIDTSYTDTSITVSFYASPWVVVESETGPRRNFRDPETIVRRTSELPAGVERVVQEGSGQGFDVTVTRILNFPDGRTETEEYFTSYVATPTIIERGV